MLLSARARGWCQAGERWVGEGNKFSMQLSASQGWGLGRGMCVHGTKSGALHTLSCFHNNRWVLFSLFSGWGNGGSERLINFPVITQPVEEPFNSRLTGFSSNGNCHSKHLHGTCLEPGTVLSALCLVTALICRTTLTGTYYYYTHFAAGETEV